MSASLPRIKTINQLAPQHSIQGLQKLKFRKLNLEPAENGQERKPSLKVLKTQRLKSLQRYTTVQEHRQYKNEKIHLNLIERKLINGTYDEKKETGNELNILKQKRDNVKVESVLKQREIDRIKILLNDVKKQNEQFNSKKGEHDIRLKQIKDKHQLQIQKTETARQTRGVFQNMIKLRHEINMVLSKRSNQLKQQVGFMNSALSLIDTELREANQKCFIQQAKLDELVQTTFKEREQRNLHISQHQQKIVKRREGQVLQAEKSKQYIALLEQVERKSQVKDFKALYNKILANLFVQRYCRKVIQDLTEKYEPYEHSYSLISSYQTFDPQNPKNLVTRYLQQSPQKAKNMKTIQQKEQYLADLQAKNQALKHRQAELVNEEMFTEQNIQKINKSGLINKQKSQVSILKQNILEIEEKNLRIKNLLLKILKDLNQKGDRRLNNGYQPVVNNITIISQIVNELIKD